MSCLLQVFPLTYFLHEEMRTSGASGACIVENVASPPARRASPIGAEWKSRFIRVLFCRMSFLRLISYWSLLLVRAFDHRSGEQMAPGYDMPS